jgi:Lrp/AsnC family transcriptional regulator, leucine-responsive regulatory protein
MANNAKNTDEIDLSILDYVQRKGRDGLAEIGAAVGLSMSAVNERLKKLQRDGVITGWSACVDPGAAGCGVLVFMLVGVDLPNERAFRRWVEARGEVLECHHVTGEWSYLLKLRVAGIAELQRFLEETKDKRLIVRSHTLLALASFKETSVLPITLPAVSEGLEHVTPAPRRTRKRQ